MVFGSDSGKLYVRPVGSGFAQGAGNVISVSDSPIRSSIVNAGNGYIYFSSLNTKIRGTSISSLLGAPTFSVITLDQSSSVSCTSTPAVSVHTAADGTKSYYLYCTYNHIYEEDNQKVERGGAVVLYIVDGNLNTLRTILAPSTNYDAIKGSPVVKNVDANNDYVYFTFNGKTGGAIGYRYNLDTYTSLLWKFTPQADEGYAVQGMAAGSNFLVYGDDNNLLYFLR
jgi:hypothetical protein